MGRLAWYLAKETVRSRDRAWKKAQIEKGKKVFARQEAARIQKILKTPPTNEYEQITQDLYKSWGYKIEPETSPSSSSFLVGVLVIIMLFVIIVLH